MITTNASSTLSSSSSSIASTDMTAKKVKHSGYRVAVICMAYSILMTTGNNLMLIPINRIFEISICRTYYQAHGLSHITADGYIDEQLCKIQPIQSKLVSLVGWDNFLYEVPSLIMAIPLIYLCENLDRRWIACFSTIGMAYAYLCGGVLTYFYNTFNLKYYWLDGLGAWFGGTNFSNTVMYSILAEAAPPGQLNKILLYTGGLSSAMQVVSQTVGTLMMQIDPYLALVAGISVSLGAIVLLPFLPNPNQLRILKASYTDNVNNDEETAPLLSVTGIACICQSPSTVDPSIGTAITRSHPSDYHCKECQPQPSESLFHHIYTGFRKTPSTITDLLFNDSTVILCLILSLLVQIGIGNELMITIWASRMYGWSLASSNYILVYNSIFSSMYLCALPIVIGCLQRLRMDDRRISLMIMTFSIVAMGLSCTLIGFSKTKVSFILSYSIYIFGTGWQDSLKALVSSISQEGHVSRSFIGLLCTIKIGLLVCSPVMAYLLNLAFEIGVRGLPFWFSGAVFGLALVFIGVVRSTVLRISL